MIEYRANRDWLADIAHLGTSWTLRRIVRAVLAVGLYATILSVAILRLGLEGRGLPSGVYSLLGVILSIILAFRTNTAYDRWWEGRRQWGTLVNHSRNLAIGLDAALPAEDMPRRATLARLIGNFAIALSGHLRGEVDASSLAGPGPLESPQEAPGPVGVRHEPARIAREIAVRVREARREGVLDGFDAIALGPHLQALMEVAGACERIRKTPIPFSYCVFIKLLILTYAAILPVGLVPEYGYLTVPLVMLVVFALLGLELMAEEIEEPFGLDCNDLPTGALAAMIRCDASELLGVCQLPRDTPAALYSKVF